MLHRNDLPLREVQVNHEFFILTRNISQALVNLNHLTRVHAESPTLVRSYASQADDRLRALAELLVSLEAKTPPLTARVTNYSVPPSSPNCPAAVDVLQR